MLDGKHCVDRFKSIGVFDLELLNILAAPVALPIIMAFSRLVIFDWTEVMSGNGFVGLLPVKESLGAGWGGF